MRMSDMEVWIEIPRRCAQGFCERAAGIWIGFGLLYRNASGFLIGRLSVMLTKGIMLTPSERVSNQIAISMSLEPNYILHRTPWRPQIAVSGEGIYINLKDRQLIDAVGGAAVACIGNGHPVVKQAITDQLNKLSCKPILVSSTRLTCHFQTFTICSSRMSLQKSLLNF